MTISPIKALVIGGTFSDFSIPGAMPIGRQNSVPIPDIDLTSGTLDSRVTYTGPAHVYRDPTGALSYSSINEWPLEYVNGVAVGRHEPEKASANVITGLTYQQMTNNGVVDGYTQIRETAETSYHRVSMTDTTSNVVLSSQVIYRQVNRPNQYLRFASSDASTFSNIAINNGVLGYVSAQVTKANASFISSDSVLIQVSFYDRGNVIGLLTAGAAVTDDSISTFAGSTDSGFDVFSMQTENSTFSTSPIDIGASRAASSVTVDTGTASNITLYFSDGTQSTASVSGSYSIPLSAANWSARYINRISFEA